jgi:hypothetical protein
MRRNGGSSPRDDLEAWRESRATTMLINGDAATLRLMAEFVRG